MPRLRSAARLRDSTLAELLLIALSSASASTRPGTSTQECPSRPGTPPRRQPGPTLSLAGLWLISVSLPLLHFVLLRWYYRLWIWGRLLLQISKIDLALIPTHPDRTGGLASCRFRSTASYPGALVHGVLLAGWVGDRIFTFDAALIDFKIEIAASSSSWRP